MKTFKDLLDLINSEIEMNKGKALNYHFDLNTHYNWLSIYETNCYSEEKTPKVLAQSINIASEAGLQLAYWTVFNTCRSGKM